MPFRRRKDFSTGENMQTVPVGIILGVLAGIYDPITTPARREVGGVLDAREHRSQFAGIK